MPEEGLEPRTRGLGFRCVVALERRLRALADPKGTCPHGAHARRGEDLDQLAHRLAHPPARVGPERRVERRVVSIEGTQEAGDALCGELAWQAWACRREGARDLLDARPERVHEPVARRA